MTKVQAAALKLAEAMNRRNSSDFATCVRVSKAFAEYRKVRPTHGRGIFGHGWWDAKTK